MSESTIPVGGPPIPVGMPFADAVEAEREGWYAIVDIVREVTPEECLIAGYYTDPDWTIRDVVAHLGTWLAEAAVQFQRIHAGTYEGHDIDIEAMNAEFLAAMAGQPWTVAWTQANSGRTRMLEEWYALTEPNEEAAWWIRKSGPEHYEQHLGRLRDWVDDLLARRKVSTGPA
jgi:Mycothiol maleylpyruvate isomerase N-terminal domain